MKPKEKKFIVVSEDGIVCNGIKDPSEVMATLLYAYLKVWDKEKFPIDIVDTGEKIVDLLADMVPLDDDDDDELDFGAILDYLFGDDDEDGKA